MLYGHLKRPPNPHFKKFDRNLVFGQYSLAGRLANALLCKGRSPTADTVRRWCANVVIARATSGRSSAATCCVRVRHRGKHVRIEFTLFAWERLS